MKQLNHSLSMLCLPPSVKNNYLMMHLVAVKVPTYHFLSFLSRRVADRHYISLLFFDAPGHLDSDSHSQERSNSAACLLITSLDLTPKFQQLQKLKYKSKEKLSALQSHHHSSDSKIDSDKNSFYRYPSAKIQTLNNKSLRSIGFQNSHYQPLLTMIEFQKKEQQKETF